MGKKRPRPEPEKKEEEMDRPSTSKEPSTSSKQPFGAAAVSTPRPSCAMPTNTSTHDCGLLSADQVNGYLVLRRAALPVT
ncbi:hypothetical protein MRX96_001579 [Rhipicephalus microplus]